MATSTLVPKAHTPFQWEMVLRLNNKGMLDLAADEIGFGRPDKAVEILRYVAATTKNIPAYNKAKRMLRPLVLPKP